MRWRLACGSTKSSEQEQQNDRRSDLGWRTRNGLPGQRNVYRKMTEAYYDFIISLVIAAMSIVLWRTARKRVQQNVIAFRPIATVSILAAVIFGVAAVFECFTQVPAGHVGVVSDQTLGAGINPVNPLATVIKRSIQIGTPEKGGPEERFCCMSLKSSWTFHTSNSNGNTHHSLLSEIMKASSKSQSFK